MSGLPQGPSPPHCDLSCSSLSQAAAKDIGRFWIFDGAEGGVTSKWNAVGDKYFGLHSFVCASLKPQSVTFVRTIDRYYMGHGDRWVTLHLRAARYFRSCTRNRRGQSTGAKGGGDDGCSFSNHVSSPVFCILLQDQSVEITARRSDLSIAATRYGENSDILPKGFYVTSRAHDLL